MAQPTQTVIYRLHEAHDPTWQFYSMPESIVGGGTTLGEARDQYRDALAFSLDTNQLPEVREYVEREAEGLGIWIRTPLGSPHQDASFKEIANQIAGYPEEDREWFYRHPTAGGDPVIVPGGPADPLSSMFKQMSPFDSLIVVMGHKHRIVWVVIAGIEAGHDDRDNPPIGLDEFGLTPASPLRDVFKVAMRIYGEQPTAQPTALLAPALTA